MPLAARLIALSLPLALAAGVAHATEVQRSIAIEAQPAEVWEAVGAFSTLGVDEDAAAERLGDLHAAGRKGIARMFDEAAS